MLRVFHAGRLEATTRQAVSAAGSSCGQRRPAAWASFLGGCRRTGALTAAGVWLLAAVGALGQGTATVSLSWDPSPSPTAVGYNVYYGTASLAYTYEQSAGAATNATVSGLLPGATYYFGVTALDAAGDESTFSNEVSYTVPGTAPTVPNPANQGVNGNNPSNSSPSNSGLPNQPGTPAPGTGPIISSIADQGVDENSTLAPLPFTVTDAQVPSSSLSFSATSSNPVLVPAGSIGFSGDGSDEMVSVSPALGQVGSTVITLSVSDGIVSNSTTFVLTVTPPPGITLTSPQTGSEFVAPATITLAADVASNGHTLSAVQFYNGGTVLGQASAPPYTLAWTGVSAGNYSLSASGTDELGNTVTSTPVLIAVSAPVVSSPPVVTLTNGNSPTNSSPSNSGLPNQPGTPEPGTGPIISSIADQGVDENSTLAPLPFTVTDAQFPSSSLSFSAMSSNPVLVPAGSIGFSGDGSDEMVSVSPALGQVGSTAITLSVSDGIVSNSTTFVLTVTPPTSITLTSPETGSGFVAPATITLAADVAANGHTLSAVQFYSGATVLGQASAPPYTLAWTGVSAGNYSLSASVTDELGSTVTSTPVLIAVSAPVVSNPPVVTLTSPADGGIYLSPANLALAANVISNGHTINAVQYFNGSTSLGTAVQPPYSLTWTDSTPGTCTLSLQTIYDTSFSVDSSAITIDVIGLSSPWLNTDIGSPEAAGAAGQTDGSYLVSGAGTIGGLSDSFQFVYQPMSGDVILYAYVSSVQDACSNGLAGVMIRESLAPEAQYAAVGLTPDGGVEWSARTNTGSVALSYTWNASGLAPPTTSNSGTAASPAPSMSGTSSTAWFCLMLVADTFFGFYSADGASWISVGSTPSNMGPSSYCGLAVSSGAPNLLNTSSFGYVNLSP